MILGLPWTAWVLLLAAVLPGVTLVLLFHRAHGDRQARAHSTDRRR